MIRNTQETYGSVTKFLHWSVSALVILMLAFSFFLEDVPKHYQPTAFTLHKSTGLLILFLMVFRLVWRFSNTDPSLPQKIPTWQRVGVHVTHYLFYIALFCMPLTGWIMSTAAGRAPFFLGIWELPFPGIAQSEPLAHFFDALHLQLAWVLIGLLVLHIAAALKHHLIDKDNIFKRMWI